MDAGVGDADLPSISMKVNQANPHPLLLPTLLFLEGGLLKLWEALSYERNLVITKNAMFKIYMITHC